MPRKTNIPQHQATQPGKESEMIPQPDTISPTYQGSGKLSGKVAIITGGDSGIGRATAILFAREGADLMISYLNEHRDAEDTQNFVQAEGQRCLLYPGDISDSQVCKQLIEETVTEYGYLDTVINNAAQQFPQQSLTDITDEQLLQTFKVNIFSYFYLSREALPHLSEGSTIINTTSVTAYRGSEHLIDYAATKGAIVAFTRSLALSLAPKKIRVNGVAPGPIWTPLIPSSFSAKEVESFGMDVPLGRPGQPEEVAPCYVFLASDDSSYMTGQILHPNGGEVINT